MPQMENPALALKRTDLAKLAALEVTAAAAAADMGLQNPLSGVTPPVSPVDPVVADFLADYNTDELADRVALHGKIVARAQSVYAEIAALPLLVDAP